MPSSPQTPEPAALKALSHPVRLRLLGELRTAGPSTASRLAERFGLNSGATSYHLRQLAQHGFVIEDDTRGNGRDRWWRAAQRSTYTSDDEAGIAGRQALDAFTQAAAVVHAESMQRAVEERSLLPDEWRRVHSLSDWQLRLTPDQALEMLHEVTAVIERWYEHAPEPGAPAAADAAPVVLQLHTYPRPGSVTSDPEADR